MRNRISNKNGVYIKILTICWNSLVFISTSKYSNNLINYAQSAGNQKISFILVGSSETTC